MKTLALTSFILGLAVFSPAGAGEARTVHVKFGAGASEALLRGAVKGYGSVDYKVAASAGQRMTASLSAKSGSVNFNIFEPGAKPGEAYALFASDTGGDRFEGKLARSGDYTIQVYLFRNAARRGVQAKYALEVKISDSQADGRPAHQTSDAKVAGTDFNATGEIPCAQSEGQPMSPCRFGVIRQGAGDATMRVFWPAGGERNIYFKGGKAQSSDAAAPVRTEKSSDLNRVFIGAERFEIPDAAIYGG
jgi:hypothetical protein